jgi:uncharacterized protein (DUF39 family)
VATAEKMVGLVAGKGMLASSRQFIVVTTGTSVPRWSSSTYFNISQSTPKIKCDGV